MPLRLLGTLPPLVDCFVHKLPVTRRDIRVVVSKVTTCGHHETLWSDDVAAEVSETFCFHAAYCAHYFRLCYCVLVRVRLTSFVRFLRVSTAVMNAFGILSAPVVPACLFGRTEACMVWYHSRFATDFFRL